MRICFRWQDRDAYEVEIVDYHRGDQHGTSWFSRKTNVFPEPIHPGEHLREDFMRPLELSVNALALALRVPATRILAIVKEKRRISPDTALRLARYFGTSPEFWLNLQTHYELALAERESMATIASEVGPRERKTA